MKQALFLDRDGVINENYGYVYKKEKFTFIDGIFDLTKAAKKKGYKVIVVTNQSGIGRGYYSEEDFKLISNWMCQKFLDKGILIEKVFYSPFHPTEGIGKYLKNDFSRKPHPGMIISAKNEFDLDLNNSVLIGDNITDIQSGISAGVRTNILFSKDEVNKTDNNFIVVDNLKDSIKFL